MAEPRAWGGEDGDDWYANGHHDLEAMKILAHRYETEDCGEDGINEAEFEGAMLRHYWVRWIDDEHGETAEAGSPGSEKMTSLYLPNRGI